MTPDEIASLHALKEAPWAEDASYTVQSSDGTSTGAFAVTDIASVIARSDPDPSTWDDTGVMVLRLHDGRYVSWVSYTDCTGSSFHVEAYGGDAIVYFSSSFQAAISHMSEYDLDLIRGQLP